jgi:hypothetical protein
MESCAILQFPAPRTFLHLCVFFISQPTDSFYCFILSIMVMSIECTSATQQFSMWTQDVCPAAMLCVSKKILQTAHDMCTCEFSRNFAHNNNAGDGCERNGDTSDLFAVLWALVAIVTFVNVIWLLFLCFCLMASKCFKRDTFALAVLLNAAAFFCLFTNNISRSIMTMMFEANVFNAASAVSSHAKSIFSIVSILSLTLTGRVMFATMMQVLLIPFDDSVERWRNYKLVFLLLIFALIVIPLRLVNMPLWSDLAAVLLALFAWRVFGKFSSMAYKGWTSQVLSRRNQVHVDELIDHVRKTLDRVFWALFCFAVTCTLMIVGWEGQTHSNYRSHMLMESICEYLQIVSLTASLMVLSSMQTAIARHRLERAARIQAIATIVNTAPASGVAADLMPISFPGHATTLDTCDFIKAIIDTNNNNNNNIV